MKGSWWLNYQLPTFMKKNGCCTRTTLPQKHGKKKYPSRGFWTDPKIGGFDPQNLVEEGKKQGKIVSKERGELVSGVWEPFSE
jgi:hypothetical protein